MNTEGDLKKKKKSQMLSGIFIYIYIILGGINMYIYLLYEMGIYLNLSFV